MTQKQIAILLVTLSLFAALFLSACNITAPNPDATPISDEASVDSIVGDWKGTMINSDNDEILGELNLSIQPGCEVDKVCGSYKVSQLGCGGELVFTGMDGAAFLFTQQLVDGDLAVCGTGSFNNLTLAEDGSLSQTWTDGTYHTHATLTQ